MTTVARSCTMRRRSATFGIYWLWISHRRLRAVWFNPGSTTATLCSTALHPAPSTNCSEYRTTPQGSFIKHQDDHTRIHCWRNYTGCRWSSASLTSCYKRPALARVFWIHLLEVYWTFAGSCKHPISQHIRAGSGTRSLRSSDVPLLYVPCRRTAIGKRSFSCAAPTTWNSLPASVINCDNLYVFKSRLKTHLFNFGYS